MGLFVIPRLFNDYNDKIMEGFNGLKVKFEASSRQLLGAIPKASSLKTKGKTQ